MELHYIDTVIKSLATGDGFNLQPLSPPQRLDGGGGGKRESELIFQPCNHVVGFGNQPASLGAVEKSPH